jgi:NAD(P)-dependent dehydrogenase (short-subunit alcohol dehydrogenase family)
MSNKNTIAVVTGASRRAGRGIAVALGRHGSTVYVTGRSEKAGDSSLPGTIHDAAAAVTSYRDTHQVAPRVQYPVIIR